MSTTIRDTGKVCIDCAARPRDKNGTRPNLDSIHIYQELTADGNIVAEGCYDPACAGYWKRTEMWYFLNTPDDRA